MNARRRTKGDETWNRLLNWTDSQKASERLAGQILAMEGFRSIDPSHPLGGPDGLKDLVCLKDNIRWVAAVFFPNGKQPFSEIRAKFEDDAKGAVKNKAPGFVFVINQYLTVSQRDGLIESAPVEHVEVYHLERIARILDTPVGYGIRLDFLDIEMTKEEQVSFFGVVTNTMDELRNQVTILLESLGDTKLPENIPMEELTRFKAMLESIVGSSSNIFAFSAPIDRLRVPISEIREFASLLYRLVGDRSLTAVTVPPIWRLQVPINELREFETLLHKLVGEPASIVDSFSQAPIYKLHVPLDKLREYEQTLDRILSKLRTVKELESGK